MRISSFTRPAGNAALLFTLFLASASPALADGPSFGKGEYTTEGLGQCFTPQASECHEGVIDQHPRPMMTWEQCLATVAPGDPYRWKNKFGKCLGSDGRDAG